MIVTILLLLLHLTQTIGRIWYLAKIFGNPSASTIVLNLIGFVPLSYYLLIVSSFRFVPSILKII